jgi:hypothetical protein
MKWIPKCCERIYKSITSQGSVSVGSCFKTYIRYIISTKRFGPETVCATLSTLFWKGLKYFTVKLRAQTEVQSFSALTRSQRMNSEVVILLLLLVLLLLLLNCRSQLTRGLRRRSTAAHLQRSWVRIQPGAWTFICCVCCVLSGRGPCNELITRPEETYRLSRVVVCDQETSWLRRP